MRLETFSYLPELTEAEIEAQIRSVLDRGLVENVDQVGHVPDVDPAARGREDAGERRPVLVEVHAARPVRGHVILTQQIQHASTPSC
jgi:hypothetical protein